MKKVFVIMLACVMGWVASSVAADQLVQFKAGDISFTLLQSDGVTPARDTALRMLSPEDGSVQAQAVSNQKGEAMLTLAEGRYLLNAADMNLAVMDVVADAELVSCRVVLPAQAMLVAGQEETVTFVAGTGATWVLPAAGIVGGAAVLVGTGFVIDHQQPAGKHHKPVPPSVK